MASEGASNNERLLAAAKSDNEDMLLEIFELVESPEQTKPFDINHHDGLGNTALHYAVLQGSTTVLEHLLCYDGCDVDPINRLEKATPLHLAVVTEDPQLREELVKSLLDAGADYRIRDKNGETAQDLVKPNDEKVHDLFIKAQAEDSIAEDDIAWGDDDDVASDDSD
jgi:ankyrin repeat protein